ncbi:MAG: proline dehydrogenase, partial [Micrococcales bacterium]
TTVTVDMEGHTAVDDTLDLARQVREDFPWLGVVLQAYLRRTEADAKDLASAGSRVRLCKGAYDEPASVAYRNSADVDRAYARALKVLIRGQGYPMIATHDPRLVEIAQALIADAGRSTDSYEFQMLHGVRPKEQRRLAGGGETVRVYLPFGRQWYEYLMRRMAERPSNAALFVRSMIRKG